MLRKDVRGVLNIAVLAFVLLSAAALSPSLSAVNYERVFYDGGAFELSTKGKQRVWVERKKDSPTKFQFIETTRTVYWITLYDPLRKFSIRLPRKDGSIEQSTDNGRTWRNLYSVRISTAAPESVTYDGGSFERFNPDGVPVWYETGRDYKPKFMFLETLRDSKEVTLYDPTRNLNIRLPRQGGTIAVSTDGGNSWRALYKTVEPIAPSTEPREKTIMFVSSSEIPWSVTSTAKGRLWSSGPFLRIALDEHTMRVSGRFLNTEQKIKGIKVAITKKKADGSWSIVRSSDTRNLDITLFREEVRKIPPSDFYIPIEGIPLSDLSTFGIVLTTLVGDDGGTTYSHSPNKIGSLSVQ